MSVLAPLKCDKIARMEIDQLRELFRLESGGRLFWKNKGLGRRNIAKEAGYRTASGHRQVMIQYKGYLVHRIVWAMTHNRWPSEDIDHIDGNPANNDPDNLREATHAQNMCNRRNRRVAATGARGVSAHGRRWRATLSTGGKTVYLGCFDSVELASVAVEAAAKALRGEFYCAPLDR